MTGTIIHIADTEGYGFIVSREQPFERIYFHWSGLIQDTLKFRQLVKGMKVEFDTIEQEGNMGLKAIDIEVIESNEQGKESSNTGTVSTDK